MIETADDKPVELARKLSRLHPISGLVHVGSGLGLGDMHQWQQWAVKDVVLIEADAERNGWSSTALAANPGWKRISATLSWQDAETEFYVASNPAESGLLNPEWLRPVWPNLQTRETRVTTSRRLDTVLGDCPAEWVSDWLLVDCLPALSVLRGAEAALSQCSVVWARVILDENLANLDGARLSAVEHYLASCGFRCVAASAGSHPAVGEALFLRDWRALLMPEIKRLNADAERNIRLRTALETKQTALEHTQQGLAEELERQAGTIAEQQALIEQLSKARDEQVRLADDFKVQLTQAKDEQRRLATERQARIDELTQAQDDLNGQAEQLRRQKQDLEHAKRELQTEVERLGTENAELAARIAQLEARVEETALRQQLFNEEMIKAEAQIDLIKDVLLREPGL